MLWNFIWAFLNTFSGGVVSSLAVIFISRNILPSEFIDLSTLVAVTTIGNIFIDFGSSAKCYLKKKLTDNSFRKIESNMLSRTLIVIVSILIFCYFSNYFEKYNNFLIMLFLLDNVLLYFIFKPNIVCNRLKLFKLRTKYSTFSAIVGCSLSIILSLTVDGKFGFIALIIINPLILCVLLRRYLNIKLPEFNFEISFKIKDIIKKEFLFQLSEQLEELLRRLIFQQNLNINLSGIYLRNESFLYSPIKIINKAIQRVVLASWGPTDSNKLKKVFKLGKIFFIFSFSIIGIYYFLGNFISNFVLGNRWLMSQTLFKISAFIIGLKFLSLQLANLIKVKIKSFNFILNVSIICSILPLIIMLINNRLTLINVLLFYMVTLIAKNIILIFKLLTIL